MSAARVKRGRYTVKKIYLISCATCNEDITRTLGGDDVYTREEADQWIREHEEVFHPMNSSKDRCPGRMRHWRTLLGVVGYRSPVCVFCGSPNPRPLSEQEWRDVIRIASFHAVGDRVRTAIEERQGASGG